MRHADHTPDDVPFAVLAEVPSAPATPEADAEELERVILRRLCQENHMFFSRWFFKHMNSVNFLVNWHHQMIADALQRVLDGKTTNLVINVPPGSSKTQMAVINFMARGLALNPNARFLHISSGDDLVLLNSQTTRDIVQSDEFQELFPLEIADDAKAKKRWNVIREVETKTGRIMKRKAGGVYAVALGGQITGFRAGHMADGFQGAIIIDDPLKADDAFSEAAVRTANRRLLSTVTSRKANPRTPTIVIMQRVGEQDPTGFIKGGNLPGEWEYLVIPALITDAYVATLPPHVRALVDTTAPRDAKGRFSYWPYKEPLESLLALESGTGTNADGNRISRFVFNAQYMQAPTALGGNIIHGEKFVRVQRAPKIMFRKIFGDTAMKTAERNDFSVFACWGIGDDGKIYLLDLIRGKWEAPELKRRALDFWRKHSDTTAFPPQLYGALRQMPIEDKASGTGLIQDLRISHQIPVKPIERHKDKLTRVMDVVSYIDAGFVCLIEGMPFNSDFVAECEAFTADDSHAYDDQIDPMCDAIVDMLGKKAGGVLSIL